jgi:hypothetical protein
MTGKSSAIGTGLSLASGDSTSREGSLAGTEIGPPESNQGPASTGALRRNPQRGYRQLREGEDSGAIEPSVSDSNVCVPTKSDSSFSLYTSIGTVVLDMPVAMPVANHEEEGLYRDPEWSHWCNHREQLREEYGRLGPLLRALTLGPGPTYTEIQPTGHLANPRSQHLPVVVEIQQALEASHVALNNMKKCCALMKNKIIKDHMGRCIGQCEITLRKFYDLEFIPVAGMKGFEVLTSRPAAGPSGQAAGGHHSQALPEGARPDDGSDASMSDVEDSDNDMA